MTEYPKYYFAYGSNMDWERFGVRIGRCIPLDDGEIQRGVLDRYEFALNKVSQCKICHKPVAKANVVENFSSTVEGIIYEIKNDTELEKLRDCEGFDKHYGECCRVIKTDKGDRRCFIYVAQADRVKQGLPVEKHYLNYIRKGKPFLSKGYYAEIESLFERIETHQCSGAS